MSIDTELSHKIHLYSNRPNLHCVFILHKQICFSLLLIAGYYSRKLCLCYAKNFLLFSWRNFIYRQPMASSKRKNVRRPLKFGLKVGNHFYFFQQCHDWSQYLPDISDIYTYVYRLNIDNIYNGPEHLLLL